jgi:exonuclease VII small subunit
MKDQGQFREAADQLLEIAATLNDEELDEACQELRDVCVDHDEVDARFRKASRKVERLLRRNLATV